MGMFDFYKRQFGEPYYNGTNMITTGEQLKIQADNVMESTWWNDPQSKVAYLYDYYHDDNKDIHYGMTYENTTKTKVYIKFYVTEKGSLSKDQPSAKIMFIPSMKLRNFDEQDELSYLNKYEEKYGGDPLIGKYIDIPNEKGVYYRWMICLSDIQGNQFQKYFVLPCDYRLNWIWNNNGKRIKQKMWVVLRSQSSYKMQPHIVIYGEKVGKIGESPKWKIPR